MLGSALAPTPSDGSNSALGVADKVFSLLQQGPAPLALAPRDLRRDIASSDLAVAAGGVLVGDQPVPLWSLRELAVRRELPMPVVNRMWMLLVTGAQTGAEAWTVGAVGMALPALFSLASNLSGARRQECPDLDAEILGGFLSGLARARPGARGLFPFLLRHARNAGLAFLTAQRLAAHARPLAHSSLDRLLTTAPDAPDQVHPDEVLAELVAAEVITGEEARVIIATRLEGISDREVAAAARLPYDTLRKRRLRAERKVAAYLGCTRDLGASLPDRMGGHGGCRDRATARTGSRAGTR